MKITAFTNQKRGATVAFFGSFSAFQDTLNAVVNGLSRSRWKEKVPMAALEQRQLSRKLDAYNLILFEVVRNFPNFRRSRSFSCTKSTLLVHKYEKLSKVF